MNLCAAHQHGLRWFITIAKDAWFFFSRKEARIPLIKLRLYTALLPGTKTDSHNDNPRSSRKCAVSRSLQTQLRKSGKSKIHMGRISTDFPSEMVQFMLWNAWQWCTKFNKVYPKRHGQDKSQQTNVIRYLSPYWSIRLTCLEANHGGQKLSSYRE